jgi:hypothetical protein
MPNSSTSAVFTSVPPPSSFPHIPDTQLDSDSDEDDDGVYAFPFFDTEAEVANVQGRRKGKNKAPPPEKPVETPVEPAPPAPGPAYRISAQVHDPEMAGKIVDQILEAPVHGLTVRHVLGFGEVRKDMAERIRPVRIPNVPHSTSATITNNPAPSVDYCTPLRELEVLLNGKIRTYGLLDEGSEIVVIRRDLVNELGLKVNPERTMTMHTANGGSEEIAGCVENLEIAIDGLVTWAHAYVVPEAPFKLLLGRPWQRSVRLSKTEHQGGVDITIHNPLDYSDSCRIPSLTHFRAKDNRSAFSHSYLAGLQLRLSVSPFRLPLIHSPKPPCDTTLAYKSVTPAAFQSQEEGGVVCAHTLSSPLTASTNVIDSEDMPYTPATKEPDERQTLTSYSTPA